MPGFDGTGPHGQGPMTGGGFGLCGGSRQGRGFGRGLGYRNGVDSPISPPTDNWTQILDSLHHQLKRLASGIEKMQNRSDQE